jgi:hypothetical protein
MESRRPHAPTPGEASPSDAEIRAIAEQLVREVAAPPAASPGEGVLAAHHELSPADEERVDAALVALGAVNPEATMRAHREGARESEPRPKSWAFDGDTPESTPDGPRDAPREGPDGD